MRQYNFGIKIIFRDYYNFWIAKFIFPFRSLRFSLFQCQLAKVFQFQTSSIAKFYQS